MRKSVVARRVGAVGSVFLLATACGGGGGGGSGAVSLKSEQDVVREIGNISSLYVEGAGSAPAAASADASTRGRETGVKRLASQARAKYDRAARIKAKSVTPKVAVTEDCPSGGNYTYEEFFETQRNLPLFAVTPSMNYLTETDRDCRYVEGTFSEYYDGYFEYGDNGAVASGETPYFEYAVDGSGDTPYRIVFEDTEFDQKETLKTLGRYEGRDNGVTYESREIFDFDFIFSVEGESFSIGAKAGESGNPLIFVDNYNGDGSLSIDGPIRYDTDFCDSGRVDFTTVQNLTLGFDDTYGTIIDGGELIIESGGTSVTLVFQSDGGVTYTFENGDTGQATLEELNSSAEPCVFFPS
jgi:hypothetical protein